MGITSLLSAIRRLDDWVITGSGTPGTPTRDLQKTIGSRSPLCHAQTLRLQSGTDPSHLRRPRGETHRTFNPCYVLGTSGRGRSEVVLRCQTSHRRTISREGLTKPDYIGLTGVAEHDQPALHDDELTPIESSQIRRHFSLDSVSGTIL